MLLGILWIGALAKVQAKMSKAVTLLALYTGWLFRLLRTVMSSQALTDRY